MGFSGSDRGIRGRVTGNKFPARGGTFSRVGRVEQPLRYYKSYRNLVISGSPMGILAGTVRKWPSGKLKNLSSGGEALVGILGRVFDSWAVVGGCGGGRRASLQ